MLTKILVPVDGSGNSFSALDAALLLSQKLGAKVTAIHVTEVAPVVHIQSEKLLRDVVEVYEKEGQLPPHLLNIFVVSCSYLRKDKYVRC
jgi:nucleotide-binding universal stress UspA family protein